GIADPNCSVTGTSSPCPVSPEKIVVGKYLNPDYTDGVAVATAARTFFPNSIAGPWPGVGSFFYDGFWNNINGGTGMYVRLSPISGQHTVVYVMVGDWSAAHAFAP